jgi:hypothetical protein
MPGVMLHGLRLATSRIKPQTTAGRPAGCRCWPTGRNRFGAEAWLLDPEDVRLVLSVVT